MKKALVAAALALGVAFAAHAAEKKAMTPQQEKMSACSKEAKQKNLKGEERKKFMSECLKAKPANAKKGPEKKGPEKKK